MHEILEITFKSFWHFVGMALLLSGGCNLIFRCWNRLMRMLNIRKHGWPPPHCDADGDFPPVPEKDDDEETANASDQ